MRLLLVAGVLVAVVGCGHGDPEPKASSSTPNPTAPTSTPVTAPRACDRLANLLPKDSYDQTAMRRLLDDVAALNNSGDTNTRTLLRPLATPLVAFIGSSSPADHRDFLTALSSVAAKCHDLGSTALD